MNDEVEIKGGEELIRDFKTVVNENYNESFNALRRVGTKFKKRLRERVRSSVKSDVNLTKGFWTSQPQGIKYQEMHVDFAGEGRKNPHWHLIEDGHKLVRPNRNRFKKRYSDAGAILGNVEGIHSVDKFYNSNEPVRIVEDEMVKTLDKALERGNMA